MIKKFIPLKRILLLAVLISVILTFVFIDLDEFRANETNGKNNGGNVTQIGDEFVGRTESITISFNWVNFIFVISLSFLGFLALGTILLGLFYLFIFNSPALIKYVNTAIRLAGFEYGLTWFGRSWMIGENVKMQLSRNRVHLTMPKVGDPREWGFKILNNQVSTNCQINQLQLKLQLIRKYLDQKI